jgi:hypothetical protein
VLEHVSLPLKSSKCLFAAESAQENSLSSQNSKMPPRRPNAHTSTDPSVILPSILKLLTSTPPDAYSAHQKARTTAARLDKSHPEAAIEVLFGVAKELMKLGEWGSAVDLGVYLVSVYEKSQVQVSVESRGEFACYSFVGSWNDN